MLESAKAKDKIPKRFITKKTSPLSLLGLVLSGFLFLNPAVQAYVDCPTAGTCVSNDADLNEVVITGPATCVQGEPVTVTVATSFTNQGQNIRYATGLFVNAVGNEVSGQTAQCVAGGLPVENGEGLCGDLGGGADFTESLSFTTAEIICNGVPEQPLSLFTMGVWSNSSEPNNATSCPLRETTSKCSNQTATTSIIVKLPAPALTVTKIANPLIYTAVGQTITYNYTVTNSGNVAISNISLTDNKLPGADLGDCEALTLDPGDSTACTGSYTITAADFSAGTVTNTATAAGTYKDDPVSGTANATVNAAKLTLDKSASPSLYQAAGTLISYNFTLINPGLVDLTGITITDPTLTSLGILIECFENKTTLAAGASMVCTASYTTTAADIAALKTIVNTAQASGLAGTTSVLSNQDSATVVAQTPAEPVQNSMTITKSASTSSYSAAGVVITYTFTVKNTGDGTINNIVVTDNVLGTISGCATSLATGASTSCTKTYTTTQADLDADKTLVNTATVTGSPTEGDLPAPQPSAVISVDAVPAPALSIDKQATTLNYDAVGDAINYSYTVTNTGNVTLNSLVVTDNKIPQVVCSPTVLAPKAVATCTATYSATQADIDAGSVVNVATASANTQQGTTVNAPQAEETVPAEQRKSLSLDKTSDPKAYTQLGDVIKYEFIITNTGNTKITGPFSISDPTIPNVLCPKTPATLAPAAVLTCTASYIITQADMDKGQVSNTATASGGGITSNEDTHVTTTQKQPSLGVKKSFTKFEDAATDANTPNAGVITVGDKVFYSIVVTNTGNVTLTNPVLVNDPLTGLKDKECATSLAPKATCTVNVTYIITKTDATNGSVTNTAVATSGESKAEGSATVFIVDQAPIDKIPNISLKKTNERYDDLDNSNSITLNDKLYYKIVVTNTGEIDLTTLVITDNVITITSNTCSSTLKTGASCVVEGFHVVNATDASNSKVENTATAQAKELSGSVKSNTVIVAITPVDKLPGINLKKTHERYDDLDDSNSVTLNDKLYYKIVVTNTGEVDLTALVITDNVITITSNTCSSTLKIGASCVVQGFHIVNANDASNTQVENTAIAEAKELSGSVKSNTVVIGIGVPIPIFGPLGFLATLLGLYLFGRRRKLS